MKEITNKMVLVRTEEAFYNERWYRLEIFQDVEKLPDSDFVGYSVTLYSKGEPEDNWKVQVLKTDASTDFQTPIAAAKYAWTKLHSEI